MGVGLGLGFGGRCGGGIWGFLRGNGSVGSGIGEVNEGFVL